MSTSPIRTRSDRVANLQIDSFSWAALWARLTQPQVLMHFGFVLLAIALVTIAVGAWNPPFPYRHGYVPARAIVARVDFEIVDVKLTESRKAQAGREVLYYYKNDLQPIVGLRSGVRDYVLRFKTAPSFEKLIEDLTEEQLKALSAVAAAQNNPASTPKEAYDAVKALLVDEPNEKLDTALTAVFDPLEESGLLKNLLHTIDEGNQRAIRVLSPGMNDATEVDVKRVRHVDVAPVLRENLQREIKKQYAADSTVLAELIFQFMNSKLPDTLSREDKMTNEARIKREAEVKPVMIHYYPSETKMVSGGKPLTIDDLELLHAEYDAWIAHQSLWERFVRMMAYIGMLLAICLLCGLFIYYQIDRTLLTDSRRLISLLGLSVACILLTSYAAQDPWRARVLPLVFCAMTSTIVFGRSVALILMTVLSLAITLTLGMDLAEFVISLSVCAASILMLGRIRTQKKPVYVALGAALVVAATTLGVGTLMGQVNGISQDPEQLSLVSTSTASAVNSTVQVAGSSLFQQLSWEAFRHAMFTILAGIILAGLLPLVEHLFNVQTDLSLLLIGDASSHALLRQLAQRAPGTYNHSITVAAIAEAAAESIGANGLLTRVGAHFHDIGKMFKPNYFIENQSHGVNCHDTLQPAMSTLVIIAHVKDGADLARQHKLPKSIIDFIEQHHGTTLVEYFYRQAAKKNEETNSGSSQVLEATFRYPGPKPQTLEAAVLMIADAVESASRTLVEPTPPKLQNLIESIAMKKLTDGQFDECGLTLTQLNVIKTSVLKTLTSIYHHRVKYDQESA